MFQILLQPTFYGLLLFVFIRLRSSAGFTFRPKWVYAIINVLHRTVLHFDSLMLQIFFSSGAKTSCHKLSIFGLRNAHFDCFTLRERRFGLQTYDFLNQFANQHYKRVHECCHYYAAGCHVVFLTVKKQKEGKIWEHA